MRTQLLTIATAVATQCILLAPALHAQQPSRAPRPRVEQRAPEQRAPEQRAQQRRDSAQRRERREMRVERWADSLGRCSCSTLDIPGMAGAFGNLRALRELEGARGREGLRRFLDADSLGVAGRMRIMGPLGRPGALADAFAFARPRPDRAMVGMLVGGASTRGLEVAEVTAGGPAERAGIRVGERITALDGTSLRVAAADSGDQVLSDAVARRLTRRLEAVTAGDTVVLRVAGSDGAERSVRVATVRADELEPAEPAGDRAMDMVGMARSLAGTRSIASIGLTTRATATPRDTLGVFVAAVVPGGRADRAGIHEGMRIVAVNGTDLRVNPADAGDRAVAMARADQLERALAMVRNGEAVTLRVRDGSVVRDVRVEAGGR